MSTVGVAASVGEALGASVDALAAAGVESPRLDAELMLAEASGLGRTELTADPDQPLPAAAGREFGAMVRRRLRREPVAYILGRKGFRRIELRVDRRVLVPRPETELLVETALELRPNLVLDVGTGSGAVALAIADELPEATVVGSDTSEGTLAVARDNARRLGSASRVRFLPGTIPPGEDGFDLIAANLPYVSESEWDRLEPEIREHEPRVALVAGPTGLEAIDALLASIRGLAQRPRAIALEVGEGQAEAVSTRVSSAGFESVESRADLAGIERVVVGRR